MLVPVSNLSFLDDTPLRVISVRINLGVSKLPSCSLVGEKNVNLLKRPPLYNVSTPLSRDDGKDIPLFREGGSRPK